MPGGIGARDVISPNLRMSLNPRLAGTGCRAHGSDLKVDTATGKARDPDAHIDCGRFHGPALTATNPVTVFELLSKSTARFDRNLKLRNYAATPSILDYVLIARDEAHARVDAREPDATFEFMNRRDCSRPGRRHRASGDRRFPANDRGPSGHRIRCRKAIHRPTTKGFGERLQACSWCSAGAPHLAVGAQARVTIASAAKQSPASEVRKSPGDRFATLAMTGSTDRSHTHCRPTVAPLPPNRHPCQLPPPASAPLPWGNARSRTHGDRHHGGPAEGGHRQDHAGGQPRRRAGALRPRRLARHRSATQPDALARHPRRARPAGPAADLLRRLRLAAVRRAGPPEAQPRRGADRLAAADRHRRPPGDPRRQPGADPGATQPARRLGRRGHAGARRRGKARGAGAAEPRAVRRRGWSRR